MAKDEERRTWSLAASRLDAGASVPLYWQIYEALRQDILRGHLRPGQRLAPTRLLAGELGVSRNTVVAAFDQLLAEGYLEGRQGAGTFVTDELPEELLERPRPAPATIEPRTPRLSRRLRVLRELPLPPGERRVRPFQSGMPALDQFPFEIWSRLASRRLRRLPPESFGYGDPAGYRPLREALAVYLRTSRGLDCEAEQVLVVAGSQQGLDLAARVLLEPGERAWVEDPGYPGARAALVASGVVPVPVGVDGEGLRVEEGRRLAPDARMACVTPSHHYPLGSMLSLSRRLRLLEWAEEADAWIVEDDYDSEYRYSGRPLTALKSLDTRGRVVYVGTFSKVLHPSLRLGYLVLPATLVDAFAAMRAAVDRQCPLSEQAVVADFLAEGHFERHVRRMRVLYQGRQEALVEAARAELGGLLEVEPSSAGMHLLGHLAAGLDDRKAAREADRAGITAAALSAYAAENRPRPGLVLGYAAFREDEIRGAVTRLARALRTHGMGTVVSDR